MDRFFRLYIGTKLLFKNSHFCDKNYLNKGVKRFKLKDRKLTLENQRKLFGTDGIRGLANQFPMTGEIAMAAGRSIAHVLSNHANAIYRNPTSS